MPSTSGGYTGRHSSTRRLTAPPPLPVSSRVDGNSDECVDVWRSGFRAKAIAPALRNGIVHPKPLMVAGLSVKTWLVVGTTLLVIAAGTAGAVAASNGNAGVTATAASTDAAGNAAPLEHLGDGNGTAAGNAPSSSVLSTPPAGSATPSFAYAAASIAFTPSPAATSAIPPSSPLPLLSPSPSPTASAAPGVSGCVAACASETSAATAAGTCSSSATPPPSEAAASPTVFATATSSAQLRPASTPAAQLQGMRGVLWSRPLGMQATTACAPALAADLGCNTWWTSASAWDAYTRQRNLSAALLTFGFGLREASAANGTSASPFLPTAVLYVPAFVADTAVWGTQPMQRVNEVVGDVAALGLQVILLLARPEFYGAGDWSHVHDVVRSDAPRAVLLAYVRAFLTLPAVAASVTFVSVYWMGASHLCSGAIAGSVACTLSEVSLYETELAAAVKGYSAVDNTSVAGSGSEGARRFRYLHHVDGPLWEAFWQAGGSVGAAPANWSMSGYGPMSLAANVTRADGVLAECWTQGSLRAGLRSFAAVSGYRLSSDAAGPEGNGTQLLMLYSVPNCDVYPGVLRCAVSPLSPGPDISAFMGWLRNDLRLRDTWSSWEWVDGGVAEMNAYGHVWANASDIVAAVDGVTDGTGHAQNYSEAALFASFTDKGLAFRTQILRELAGVAGG